MQSRKGRMAFTTRRFMVKHFLLVTKCAISPRQFLVVSPENSIIHGQDHGWLSGNCQALTGRRKQLVVHFDRLKLCSEDTRITAPCQPTVIEQSTTATQARPTLSDLEIIDEPEPDPLPPYQHRYLLQHLYLLLNRRLLLLNQSQFLGTYHRYCHLDTILSELELCRIVIQHILLTESEYGTYSLGREHCSKHCHVVVVLCVL